MLKGYFYHGAIRNTTAIFGNLFNNIYVLRKHGSVVKNQERVPLAYSPKQKFLARLEQLPDVDGVKQGPILPRIGFEITALTYDAERQFNKNDFCLADSTDPEQRTKVYNPVPYILSYQLIIIAKTEDDMFQIVEQIAKIFKPSYTLDILPIPGRTDIDDKIKFKLTSIGPSDDFEGDFQSRRIIMYTLDFDAHINIFDEVKDGGDGPVIKTATIAFKDFTINTETYGTVTAAVNPSTAEITDTHTIDITESWDE